MKKETGIKLRRLIERLISEEPTSDAAKYDVESIARGDHGEIVFAIMTVRNPYGRGTEHGWASSFQYDSVKDFKSGMKRRLEGLARKHFVDILAGGGTAKYYTNSNVKKFIDDYKKLTGSTPNVEGIF